MKEEVSKSNNGDESEGLDGDPSSLPAVVLDGLLLVPRILLTLVCLVACRFSNFDSF
jgi:hypothetical protein